FRALRTLEGKKLADGEMTQVTEGDRLTDDLIFRFKDGSIYEDKTVFTQKGSFRLLSDHLVKKGPSFKQPMETLIDASTGQVTVHYKDHDGKEKVLKQNLNQPPDSHVWVLGGAAPAFVKFEGPLYQGGPIWSIELAKPAGFP